MSLQDLVNVSISSSTVTPTRPGFGTPMGAVYHTLYTDLARKYSNLAAVVADGFTTASPGYKLAAAMFAQNPAPPAIYLGRRALAYSQVLTFTLSSTSALDTYKFTVVD